LALVISLLSAIRAWEVLSRQSPRLTARPDQAEAGRGVAVRKASTRRQIALQMASQVLRVVLVVLAARVKIPLLLRRAVRAATAAS